MGGLGVGLHYLLTFELINYADTCPLVDRICAYAYGRPLLLYLIYACAICIWLELSSEHKPVFYMVCSLVSVFP